MKEQNFKATFMVLLWGVVLAVTPGWRGQESGSARAAKAEPTFYRDVLPVLQGHCQQCHRAGGIAPMAFETYEETRPFATAIRNAVERKSMPPWFADAGVGHFSNDPSLSAEQIAALGRPVERYDARDVVIVT